MLSASSQASNDEECVDTSVHVNPEDIDMIVRELEVSRTDAERSLRRNGASPVEALRALMKPCSA